MKAEIMWAIRHKDFGVYFNNFAPTRKEAWAKAEKETGNDRKSLRKHGDRAIRVEVRAAPSKGKKAGRA